jgi:hemolysin activation/secretion protein
MPQQFPSKLSLIFSLGFVLLTSTAFAQTVPTTVEPGRVQSDLDRQNTMPKASTPPELTTTADVQAPKGAEKISFVLKTVNIAGGKQISHDKIEATYKELIGKKITLVQVYEIANKITRVYRDNGYILSRAVVPQQEIAGGNVKIQIVEGFVSSYTIQGNTRGNEKEIKAYADKLVGSGALTSKNLERYLLLMNDLPGMKVRSVLAPSKTTVGGADMTLVLEQKVVQGLASVDNYGNSYLGPTRFTVGGQVNSAFQSSDQWNGTFLWAPDRNELDYYSAGFKHNIGSEGTKAGVNVSYTETDPDLPAALGGTLEPEGRSVDFSFTLDHPFIRSRAFNVFGGLSFDITKNNTDYGPGLAAIETEDRQRIIRANGQLTYLDNWAGYNAANASVSQGLHIMGSSSEGDSNLSRTEGDPTFTKANLELSRLQRIWGPFTGLVAVAGQVSNDPLLASEEFGFGGNEYGRGYDSSEITGDQGVASKVELAYSHSVQKKYFNDYQIYTFYDLGKVWNKDPGAGQPSRESAASAGIGTRMTFLPNVKGDMFIAKPLTHDVPSRGIDNRDWRFKFSVNTNF